MGQSTLHSLNKTGLFMYWSNIWDTKKNYTKITLENIIINKFINNFFKNRYYLSYRIFNHKTLHNFNIIYNYFLFNLTKKLFKLNKTKIITKFNLFLEYKTGYNFIKNNALTPVYCMKTYIFRFKNWIVIKYSIYLPKNFKIILQKKKFFKKTYKNRFKSKIILLKFINLKKTPNELYKLNFNLINMKTAPYKSTIIKNNDNIKKIIKYFKLSKVTYKRTKQHKLTITKKKFRSKFKLISFIVKKTKKIKYKINSIKISKNLKNKELNFSKFKYKFFKSFFFKYIYLLLKNTLKKKTTNLKLNTLNKKISFLKKKKLPKLIYNFINNKNFVYINKVKLFYKNKLTQNINVKKLNLFIYIFKYKFNKFCKKNKYTIDIYKNKRILYKRIIKKKIYYKKYKPLI